MKSPNNQERTIQTRCELKQEQKMEQRRAHRIQQRERRKEENHWNFKAGELVAKYLKEDLNIPVSKGTDCGAKNAEAFKPLANILIYLAEHKEFTRQIMNGDVSDPI